MSIGPNTALYLSMSSSPGQFGATVYNTLFDRLGIDAVYMPRRSPTRPEQIIDAIETLDVRGCSVSSPHKSAIVPLLHRVDSAAADANAVNTIYRDADGSLIGACTDIDGVVGALGDRRPGNAVIYGSGGVVGPTVAALRKLGVDRIGVVSRNLSACESARARFEIGDDPGGSIDLLINATPDGRDADPSDMLSALIARCEAVLDMPVLPDDSGTIRLARSRGKDVITGVEMCIAQITAQARIYTGLAVDQSQVERIVREDYFGGG